MRRRLFTILICLLLGVLVNVAVAALCGAFVNSFDTEQDSFRTSAASTYWGALRNSGLGVQRILASVSTTEPATPSLFPVENAPGWSRCRDRSAEAESLFVDYLNSTIYMVDEGRGWPFISMSWEADFEWFHSTTLTSRSLPIRHGIPVRQRQWVFPEYSKAIPLKPFWPGFVLNSIFYALAIFGGILLVRHAPQFTRSAIRRRRGQCPKCAYDLRGAMHSQCPECGAAILRRLCSKTT